MQKRIEQILLGSEEQIRQWIDVPPAREGDIPFFQSEPNAAEPTVLEQAGVGLRLACGTYENKTGPLKNLTPVISISGIIRKGKRVQFTATPGYRTLLYLAKGAINVNCETVNQYNLIVFEIENDEIIITAEEDTQVLYLSAFIPCLLSLTSSYPPV